MVSIDYRSRVVLVRGYQASGWESALCHQFRRARLTRNRALSKELDRGDALGVGSCLAQDSGSKHCIWS